MFSSHSPVKGKTLDDIVDIRWQDGRHTKSRVTWYGDKTRAEYRLTRFGRKFPFLNKGSVGDLFVLVPTGRNQFDAFVFDSEDDIEAILGALGLDISDGWGVFKGGSLVSDDPAQCEADQILQFVQDHKKFPAGDVFSDKAVEIVDSCYPKLSTASVDERLLRSLEVEFRLFRSVESSICGREVAGPFGGIDEFLGVAATIMGRRKSRAGRSLENHVAKALERSGIEHDLRVRDVQGAPDLVIPGVEQYRDLKFPRNQVFVVGVKTTCKDRWRQILNEGPLVKQKYLLTVQPGISAPQVKEMIQSDVTLVVPEPLHQQYPTEVRPLLNSVEEFLDQVQRSLQR